MKKIAIIEENERKKRVREIGRLREMREGTLNHFALNTTLNIVQW